MSTDMRGIMQESLFGRQVMLSVMVAEASRYRVLSNVLPWVQLAEVANEHRSKKIDIHNGRTLDLRLHLGAFVAQSMSGWTDRETEEMVRYHAGVRMLCGLQESSNTTDRTRIEGFRTLLGKEGVAALNAIIVQHAMGAGFTGTELCASDTTVQESPICYPTEVGHMKKIAEKLVGIGLKLGKKASQKLSELGKKAQGLFTEIRLFTRGKAEEALARKKDLSKKLHKTVKQMAKFAKLNLQTGEQISVSKAKDAIAFYEHMLAQIRIWLNTGFHPKDKVVSLWEKSARAISKGKAGKKSEFGRRWIITRLLGGYVIGAPCQKLGADSDTSIADEVMINFLDVLNEVPSAFVFDRGADSAKHDQFLKNSGVEYNCIFPKGQKKMDVPNEVFEIAKTERSLTEASIAHIKNPKYNFTKPRAKTTETCLLKGHSALMGFNINNLVRDVTRHWGMALEIT